jgi:hypothetical protein
MPTSKSIVGRAATLAAMLGGSLWVCKITYEGNKDRPYPADLIDAPFLVVPLLMLAGLAGLYVLCRGRLDEQDKRGHRAGFVLGFVGLMGTSVSSGLWALGLISDDLVVLWLGVLFVGCGFLLARLADLYVLCRGTTGRGRPRVHTFVSASELHIEDQMHSNRQDIPRRAGKP